MEWRKRIISGLGIGSFVYLLMGIFNQTVVVTSKSIILVFLLSIFVGVTTIVFDIEKLSYPLAFLIHYLLVAVVVTVCYSLLFGIENLCQFLIGLTAIYLISYLVTIIKTKMLANELNRYLDDFKKNKK